MAVTLTESDLRTQPDEHKLYRVPGMAMTEGVKRVADRGDAFWLVSDIAAFQHDPGVAAAAFQVWKLSVKDRSAELVCEDGDGNLIFSHRYYVTDFPLAKAELWVESGEEGRVILLPCEH